MAQCDNGAFLGRLAQIDVFLGCSTTAPDGGSYISLGGTRGLSISGEWGTTDVTTRDSANAVREYIATYKDFSGSVDGTTLRDSTTNQKAIWEYVATTTSPDAWVRITIPFQDGSTWVHEYPALLTTAGLDLPYEDLATFSFDWQGNGQPVFTDVPAQEYD